MVAAVGRQHDMQAVHFLRKTITFANDGQTINVGYLPAGATIIKDASGVAVTTAFDGDTTNAVDIGPSTDTDLYGTALDLGTTTFVPLDEAVTALVGSSTVLIQAAVTSTASATAGSAEIVICYVPDTDG